MKKQIKLKLIFALVIGAIALAFAPFCLNVKMASDNQNQNNDEEKVVDGDGERGIGDTYSYSNFTSNSFVFYFSLTSDILTTTYSASNILGSDFSSSDRNAYITANGSTRNFYLNSIFSGSTSFTAFSFDLFNVGDFIVYVRDATNLTGVFYHYYFDNGSWSYSTLLSQTGVLSANRQFRRNNRCLSLVDLNTTIIDPNCFATLGDVSAHYDLLDLQDNTYNCYYLKEQDSFYNVNNTNHVVASWLDDEDVLHELRIDNSILYLDVTSDNSVSTTIIGDYNKDDVIAMVIYRNTNVRSVPVYIYININTLSCSLNNGVVSFESEHKYQFGDNITVNDLTYNNELVTASYFTDDDYNLIDPLFRGNEIVEEVFDSYLNNALQHSYELGVQNGSVSNYSDLVFDNCRLYGWALSSLGDADNVLYYYNDAYNEVDPEYDIIENAVSDGDWVSLQNLNDFYSVDYSSNYFYMLLVPNVTITDSFTIRFTNSVGGNVHILYDNFEYVDDAFSGTDYTYVIPQEFLGHSIIALGFVNYTDNNYCRYITCTSSEIVASMYYQQGYDSGYRRGYDFGQDDANDVFNSEKAILVSTIRSQQEQLDTLNANNVNLTFRDTLNTILSYPVKLVRRVFYNEKLVVDANNQPVLDAYGNAQYESTTPIELFGVSLPGLVMGIFAIALTIGVIAIVKKVWK